MNFKRFVVGCLSALSFASGAFAETVSTTKSAEQQKLEARVNAERKIDALSQVIRINSSFPLSKFASMLSIEIGDKDSMVVVLDGPSGKTTAKDPAKSYDLMSDLFEIYAKGGFAEIEKGRNVSLDIALKDNPSAKRLILNLNANGEGGDGKWFLVNCSVMLITESGYAAFPSYMLFEPNPDNAVIAHIDSIRAVAEKKLKEVEDLTDLEGLCVGSSDMSQSIELAKKAMGESRYADAIELLEEQYDNIKPFAKQYYNTNLSRRDGSLYKTFYEDICMSLVECYEKRGLYDMSLFYTELAFSGMDEKSKKDAEEKLNRAMTMVGDFRVIDGKTVKSDKKRDWGASIVSYIEGEISTFGAAIETEFGIQQNELTTMLVVPDDNPDKAYAIGTPKDIYKFAFVDSLLASTGFTAFISYRSHRDKADTLSDKSTAIADNELIVRLDLIPNGGDRPQILARYFLPVFAGSQTMYPTVSHASLNYSIDKTKVEVNVNSKSKPDNLFAALHNAYLFGDYQLGYAAYKEQRWGDALAHLINAHRKISKEVMREGNKSEHIGKLKEVDFMLGYTFCELKIYKYAVAFLSRFFGDDEAVAAEMEFVNSLCNSKDVRALQIVEAELARMAKIKKKNEGLTQYEVFLKRRKAYMLVEGKQFDDAKQFLTTLLKDEDQLTRQYAQGELDYIEKMEKEGKTDKQ